MNLKTAGEFGLIDRFRGILGTEFNPQIRKAIGDDAAVFKTTPGMDTVWSVDALVEDVHFDLDYVPMEALGWKALAVNLSDLAAMGAVPRYALVSLAIPESWTVSDAEELYSGLQACSREFDCQIIGGDTTRSPDKGFISISVMGEVESGQAFLRCGARADDVLCCTGFLGRAKTGFEVLLKNKSAEAFTEAVHHFLKPRPRIVEARWLMQYGNISAMIDISDGLASEIHHLCRESQTGCVVDVDKIPITPEVKAWFGESWQTEVLNSGEEYELLFTVSKKTLRPFLDAGRARGIPITAIGKMTEKDQGVQMRVKNQKKPLSNQGWNHFL